MEEENPLEKSRRHYSPQQKVAILREHLIEQVLSRSSARSITDVDPDSYSFRYTHSKKGVSSLPAELKRINLRHFAEMAERLADYLDAVDTAVGVVHDAKQEMEAEYRREYWDYA